MHPEIEWHCVCGDVQSSHVSRPDGEHCYGHCQHTTRNCGMRGFRPIDHADRTPAITSVFAAAEALRMPEHYTCDLSTDYQALIKADPDDEFIWLVRTNGTHLWFASDLHEDHKRFIRQSLDYIAREHEEAHYFWWDGAELHEISVATARDFVWRNSPGLRPEFDPPLGDLDEAYNR